MKSLLLSAAATLLCVSFASAQVPSNVAWVRVVHAASDAPAVDVLANGNLVFQGIQYKGFTEYTPVPPATYDFSVNVSGTTTTVLRSGPTMLRGGSAYTFFAFGKVGGGTLQLMGAGDEVEAPGMGMAKIRVVHGASTAPNVDVYATTPYAPLMGAPALSNVPFPLASGYLAVPAGVYQARVTVAGTRTVAIDSGRFPLMSNTTRTVVALDPATEGGGFELLVLPDFN
jgi:hypothetical protein